MTDTNDSEDDYGYDFDPSFDELFGQPMAGMFGSFSEFTGDATSGPSEETEVAIKLIKSADAINQFAEYLEENDIDINDLTKSDVSGLTFEQQMMLSSFTMMAQSLEQITEQYDDSNDDNPFRKDGDTFY